MQSVLIVDDHAENLYFLEALLRGNGFAVRAAQNGALALAAALKDPPDLIVTDILMPVMDGYMLCREWRASERLKGIPFVFYTATYTEKKDKDLALSLGADRFVVKPQEPDVLLGIVREVLAASGSGGGAGASPGPTRSEAELLRDYNEVLFDKLQRKIADLEAANRELRESEGRFRAVLESMSLLGVMLDRNGRITLCNDFLLELTGWKRDEVLNREWFGLFLPPDVQETVKRDVFLKGVGAGEIPVHFENEIVTRGGERRLIKWSNSTLRDHAGSVIGAASVGEDITDRRAAEASLRESEGLYRQLAADWERRVRERTAQLENANRELEASKAEAEAATRAKSEFLANMSHELRTPLNSILGFSEIMRDGLVGDVSAQQQEYLNDIWESGNHLLRLINDILDISKIEAGKMTLERGVVDFSSLVGETLMLFREKAALHRIGLHVEVANDLYAISVDGRRIKQVLINLLANTLKFTPDGGEVGVEAAADADEMRVAVWDTGIGIAPENFDRLFQPFQQLDAALTRKYEGSGLGLHLCRKIVEQHGGRIWVESAPGRGSRFIFTIPIAAAQAP